MVQNPRIFNILKMSSTPAAATKYESVSPVSEGHIDMICMASTSTNCLFQPTRLTRRALGANDVRIEMRFCGVCHTDLHNAAGHLQTNMAPMFPMVPGHELAGICTAVGASVTRVKVGDHVGIGCMVDSCLNCAACKRGEEQMCTKQTATYNGLDNGSHRAAPGPGAVKHTLGGYSSQMVVHERFAIIIPPEYPLEYAGPVMCAGVTLFDPLRRYNAKEGTRVGIVGIGGLGQMGVKLAKALGCVVTAITRSETKGQFARKIGAEKVLLSSSSADMSAAAGSLDLILNTIPIEHDFNAYNSLLAGGGSQIMLGLNSGLVAGFIVNALCCGNSKVKGSGIGGIESTQQCIDLCAKHNIRPEIKLCPVWELSQIYENLDSSNESGERYVLDLSTLNDAAFEKCKEMKAPSFGPQPQPMTKCSILCACFGLCCGCKAC